MLSAQQVTQVMCLEKLKQFEVRAIGSTIAPEYLHILCRNIIQALRQLLESQKWYKFKTSKVIQAFTYMVASFCCARNL